VTVWNDARFTRRLAHVNWMANTAVLMHLNERATGDPARDWLSSWAHRWFVGDNLRVLVLGCGEGWLERALAQWPFVARIDAVDFAEEAVQRARELARGVDKIQYGVVDLNRDELQAGAYDVVVAHSVLHHIENLEHAYVQLERAMKDEGTLIVNEYVGADRFQYGDDVAAIMNALLAAIGAPPRARPTVEEMIANDPTEAVRASELMTFTRRFFDVREEKRIGGTLLQHMLYEIVQNFRFEVPRERAALEMLCTIEAMLVDSGRIPCDFVILAATKKGERVRKANRALPPRPKEAEDVEEDPLGSAGLRSAGLRPAGALTSGRRRPEAAAPAGWKPALRLLRLAFLAQQPTRAILHRERTFYTLRERFRARGRDPWQWLLERAPDDPVLRPLLHAAATLARD
jgi:2-polyprenyl-3-methyl-5-hydroxy-6-metoxy-1,4-benzoquinol methylase